MTESEESAPAGLAVSADGFGLLLSATSLFLSAQPAKNKKQETRNKKRSQPAQTRRFLASCFWFLVSGCLVTTISSPGKATDEAGGRANKSHIRLALGGFRCAPLDPTTAATLPPVR